MCRFHHGHAERCAHWDVLSTKLLSDNIESHNAIPERAEPDEFSGSSGLSYS